MAFSKLASWCVHYLITLSCCNTTDIKSKLVLHSPLSLSFHRTLQNTKTASGSLVISNTFPPLLSNPRLMHISSILQMVTRYRTEKCCESLVWIFWWLYVMLLQWQSHWGGNCEWCHDKDIDKVDYFFMKSFVSWRELD